MEQSASPAGAVRLPGTALVVLPVREYCTVLHLTGRTGTEEKNEMKTYEGDCVAHGLKFAASPLGICTLCGVRCRRPRCLIHTTVVIL